MKDALSNNCQALVCECAIQSSSVQSEPKRDQRKKGLGNAINALGPQGREIQWAKRKIVKQDLTDVGVLLRPWSSRIHSKPKVPKEEKRRALWVRRWT